MAEVANRDRQGSNAETRPVPLGHFAVHMNHHSKLKASHTRHATANLPPMSISTSRAFINRIDDRDRRTPGQEAWDVSAMASRPSDQSPDEDDANRSILLRARSFPSDLQQHTRRGMLSVAGVSASNPSSLHGGGLNVVFDPAAPSLPGSQQAHLLPSQIRVGGGYELSELDKELRTAAYDRELSQGHKVHLGMEPDIRPHPLHAPSEHTKTTPSPPPSSDRSNQTAGRVPSPPPPLRSTGDRQVRVGGGYELSDMEKDMKTAIYERERSLGRNIKIGLQPNLTRSMDFTHEGQEDDQSDPGTLMELPPPRGTPRDTVRSPYVLHTVTKPMNEADLDHFLRMTTPNLDPHVGAGINGYPSPAVLPPGVILFHPGGPFRPMPSHVQDALRNRPSLNQALRPHPAAGGGDAQQKSDKLRVAVFSTKSYDKRSLTDANAKYGFDLAFFEEPLTPKNAYLADGFSAICIFANDHLTKEVLDQLEDVKLVALRAAGTDKVDKGAAEKKGIQIKNVPAYDPHGVAEHAVALMLALSRHIPQAYLQVKERNFELGPLEGFTFSGKTVGVMGTGKIGQVVAEIMLGFGCKLLAYDIYPNRELEQKGVRYCGLEELFRDSDIISLHTSLTKETRHIINRLAISKMKKGVMLINTGRGALVDTEAVIQGLEEGHIGYVGLDVYEMEDEIYYHDHRQDVLPDKGLFARLVMMPNTIVTGHQAFLTSEALKAVANETLKNIADWQQQQRGGEGAPRSRL